MQHTGMKVEENVRCVLKRTVCIFLKVYTHTRAQCELIPRVTVNAYFKHKIYSKSIYSFVLSSVLAGFCNVLFMYFYVEFAALLLTPF